MKTPAGSGRGGRLDPDWKLRSLVVAAGLALVTVAIFRPVAGLDFVSIDDPLYVTQNNEVTAGISWRGAGWAFSSLGYAANWHPLTWISHMLDVSLFGLDAGAHHLVNLLLHLLNTILLLGVLYRMSGSLGPSAFMAALFALHPLHVESVAWVAERKDLLSTLFWILTMGAYLHHLRRPSPGRYALTVGLFALGLMAKPMLVTLPFVLLLLDGWPLNRWHHAMSRAGGHPWPLGRWHHAMSRAGGHPWPLNRWRPVHAPGGGHPWPLGRWRRAIGQTGGHPAGPLWLLLEKVPLLGLAAASAVVTLLAQERGKAIHAYPFSIRLGNALVSYARYLGKMVWPNPLAVFYPHPENNLSSWTIAAAFVLLAGITVLAILNHRSRPYLLTGWFWYLVTLVPVIGLVQVGSQAMADRYTYVPLTGLFIAAAWGGATLAASRPRARVPLAAAALAVLALLAPIARRQVCFWRDNLTLFGHAVEVTENNWLAHNNLGLALAHEKRYAEAVDHYHRALAITVDAEILSNLGTALAAEGHTKEAAAAFRLALDREPDKVGVHVNLALALSSLGDTAGAIEHFTTALKLKPDMAEAHNNLGIALAGLGRDDEALAHFRKAARLKPGMAEAHNNIGANLAVRGRLDEAVAEYREAIRLNPDYYDAMAGLGDVFRAMGRKTEAGDWYRRALRGDPGLKKARDMLQMLNGDSR